MGNRFAYRLEPGKMNDAFYVVFGKYLLQHPGIAHTPFYEGEVLARQGFYPVQYFGAAIAQVVQNHDMMAALHELNICVGANIASASTEENFAIHDSILLLVGEGRMLMRTMPIRQV